MAIVNGYATLATLKARLAIPSATVTYDTALEAAIEAASRRVDDDTGCVFFDTAGTRFYTADNPVTLFLPDQLLSVSSIATLSSAAGGTRTYGHVWSATDYDLEPYDGPPYGRISRNPTGLYAWPVDRKAVRVIGVFGFCVVGAHPRAIGEAALIMAARLFERSKSPLGLVGGEGMIESSVKVGTSDPDYNALIRPYRRHDMVVMSTW